MISAMEPVQTGPKMGDTHASKPMKVKINRQPPGSDQPSGRRGSKIKEPREHREAKEQHYPQDHGLGDQITIQRDMLAQQNALLLQQMAHLNQAFWCSQMQTAALVAKDMAATNPYWHLQRPAGPFPLPQPGSMEPDSRQRRSSSKSRKNRKPSATSATMSPQNSMSMSPQNSLNMHIGHQASIPMTPQASLQSMCHPMTLNMCSQWSDVSTAIPFSPQSSLQSSFAGSRRGSLDNNLVRQRRGSNDVSSKPKADHANSKQPKVAPEEKPQPQTTVMIRNLIETCTRQMLLDFLSQQGFEKQFDMVYLPLKFCSKLCFHYAFVNFVSEEVTKKFIKELQGYKGAEAFGEQACDISMSVDNQGLQAAIKRYRNSPVMHPSVPDECKPLIFQDGVPIPFPPPTKNIRKPRKDMGDVSKDAEEEQPKEIERRSSFESQISEE